MILKYGKPVDIIKFKNSMLKPETLKAMIEKNAEFGKYVKDSAKSKAIDRCLICGSKGKMNGPSIYEIRYNICSECGMFYSNLQLAPEELKKYYTESKDYHKVNYADKKTFQYRAKEISSPKIDFISKFINTPRRRWLDIGSGIGDVVFNLKQAGFDARGLEINESSIKFSKEVFGVNLEQKDIYKVLKEEGGAAYDVISYFGVLEHMLDPIEQVSSAVELLSPGGLLVLEVPNAQSFSAMTDSIFTDSVVRQMTPFLHIMLFSQKSLLKLSDKFGLNPEAMWFIGLDFYNLILHLGAHIQGFLESKACQKMLESNNEIQDVFDKKKMSDQILFIARKPDQRTLAKNKA